jgi:Protein of unknown function with PCYCGC motif
MVPEFAQIDNESITRTYARTASPPADEESQMDRPEPVSRAGSRRLLRRARVALVALLLVSGPAFAACSGAHDPSAAAAGANGATGAMETTPAASSMSGMSADVPPVDASEAWAARPAFVRTTAQTEEAYAFAMYHPQVTKWMPCYCGCAATGHRSNLDCYLKPGQPGAKTVFEEHASYCDLCVQITLKTKQLYAEGRSLREIRQAVDQQFGGSAPGTSTEQPPA